MHGLLLSRKAYLRMLSRIAGMGFLVVAVDAAGHGDTGRLPSDACGFTDRADSVLRTLDALGIGQALFVGHSMGGRMTIQLAARAPERVLAAVLFDPAAGARFDTTIPTLVKSPTKALGAAYTAIRDTLGDPTQFSAEEQFGYFRVLAAVAVPNLRYPLGAVRTIKAIIESGDYTPMLHTMRDEGMPTKVVHAEKDMIVPLPHARELANASDATLYKVPNAYHSWMIANPRQGADAFRQLLDGELGEVLRNAPTQWASRTSMTTRRGSANCWTPTRWYCSSSTVATELKSGPRSSTMSNSSWCAVRSVRRNGFPGLDECIAGGRPSTCIRRDR